MNGRIYYLDKITGECVEESSATVTALLISGYIYSLLGTEIQ